MVQISVKIKTLPHFKGRIPHYQTAFSSGCDVEAALETEITLKPGQRALVPTGLVFEIPPGFEIQVRPRSGLALKSGITLVNTPGTIDSDYRGELKVILINLGQEDFHIKSGDRVAQLVFSPVIQAGFELVENVAESIRGEGGFGSTGINL